MVMGNAGHRVEQVKASRSIARVQIENIVCVSSFFRTKLVLSGSFLLVAHRSS
jgi:hypothetical protein